MWWRETTIEELIRRLKSDDDLQGVQAVESLVSGGAQAIQPLIDALRDGGTGVHERVVEALTRIGSPSVDPLIDLLSQSNSPLAARGGAVEALGRIGDQRALSPLLSVLKDEQATMRREAAEALSHFKDLRAVFGLIDHLNDPGDSVIPVDGVIATVADALVSIGELAVLPLIAVLEDRNRTATVRESTATVLGRIGGNCAVAPLISILEDRNDDSLVRNAAARGLALLGDMRAFGPLARIVEDKGENLALRRAAIRSLAKLPEQNRAFLLLRALLQDLQEDTTIRELAAWHLCQVGDKRAVVSLVAALEDADASIRASAAGGLARCGDASTLPPLERAQHDDDERVRVAAKRTSRFIKNRIGLPLSPEEDIASKLLARYGPVYVYEPKEQAQGVDVYVLRVDDGDGLVDLGLAKVDPASKESVLGYLDNLLRNWQSTLIQREKTSQDVLSSTGYDVSHGLARRAEAVAHAVADIALL